MFIYLIRHGETPWNAEQRILGATDIELSESGRFQAETLAEFMSDRPIHAIYSSDLKRAFQTADALARFHGLEVRTHSGLREMNQGILEGLTFEQLKEKHPDFLESWKKDPTSLCIQGGESLSDLQERAWETIHALAHVHQEDTIAIISHNLTIVTFLCKLLGVPLRQFRQLRQGCTGINLIEYGRLGWALHYMNLTSHLQGVDGYHDPALHGSRNFYREGEPRWSPDGGSA
jgi:broad specificity phosphatase PhoE